MAELVQPDRHRRVVLVPDADRPRQEADREREHRGDLELAALELQRGPHAARAAVRGAERAARLREQRAPGRRDRDSAREPLDERAAELVLE